MKKIIIIFIIFLFSTMGYAQVDPKVGPSNQSLGNDDEKVVMASAIELIDNGSYCYSKDSISQEVMTKLYEIGLKEPIFANPGENFQAGDVVKEPGLPWRQLIVVIKGKEGNCIIAYYHGGFAFHEHIIFFETKDDKIFNFWTGEIMERGTKERDTVQLLREKKFRLKRYLGEIPATCQY